MNLNPTNPLTPEEILAKLKEMQNFFLKTAIPENINSSSSQTAPHRIYRSRINQLHRRPNPQPETHPLERIYKGQLNRSFFSKFSESFNLMEPFIQAQSANDLVIALCSLGNNLKFNFQKERSLEMLKHLNSNEGRIFLKHKIDRIINDTTKQILRDPHLNSPNSGKGSAADDDLTKSAGNIATKNEFEQTTPSEETTSKDDLISTNQKLSLLIQLFDDFIASGLKHSARDLLLGMDKDFSEKLELNLSSTIASDRPFLIINTAQDPRKSGIEIVNLIDYSSRDSDGNKVINTEQTLKSFTEKYIYPKKINQEPVDKEIQPYLNKLINEISYPHLSSHAVIESYLKAVQKGYKEEANEFLTRAIQDKFKTFLPSDVFLEYHTGKEELNALTDLMKWAVEKKFLPKKDFPKTLLSLIAETNKLKDDPKKLLELRGRYKLLEPLFDKVHDTYRNGNSADERIINYAVQEIKRANKKQDQLEKSISELEQYGNLLEKSFKMDSSQAAGYNQLTENEKGASEEGLSEKLLKMTVAEFLEQLGINSTSQVKAEPSKEDVLQALKRIYIQFELNSFDEQENNLGGEEDNDEIEEDDDEGEVLWEADYGDSPLNPLQPLFLEEIPSLFEEINKDLNTSLDQKKIKAMGIDLARITSKDLGLKSIGTVANEAFLEFKQERRAQNLDDTIDLWDDAFGDHFNNIILKKLINIHEEQPNALRFALKTRFNDLVDLENDLKDQDPELVLDRFRLPEIFVNRETEFYKKAPNRKPDGSFKIIDNDNEIKPMIHNIIECFKQTSRPSTKELDLSSKTSLNEIIKDLIPEDYFTTETHRITFLYFSLLESNLKDKANIILYKTLDNALSENSTIDNQRLANILPVFKYAKENGYLENFKNEEEEINFDKFNYLLKYAQQDCLDQIENPKVSNQKILQFLELSCSDKNLNPKLISDYRKSLLKRLLPDEKLISSPLYLENNLPDLIALATMGEKSHLLNSNNLETFKRHFRAEDLVRLTPAELVQDFFKNSSDLKNILESSILESFQRIKNLESSTRFVNDMESLVDKAFTLDNQSLTQKLTGTLREEIPSLEINPNNAAAYLSLLNCIFHGIHDFKNSDNNKQLRSEYSKYLDLPLGLKESPDDSIHLGIMLIAKMEEALQSFEKFLNQNKTLKREDFPQSFDSKDILQKIGLPSYS